LPFFTRRVTYLIARNGVVADRVIADLSEAAHRRIIAAARSVG
jgi:hypothetical protein